MEKRLTRNELLIGLLRIASNPFTSLEKKLEIKKILEDSSTMRGMNHLFLLRCHFEEEHPLFYVSEEEAFRQAKLALKENNRGAYYYLYLLYRSKDEVKARNYLRLSCDAKNPYAFLEMGKLQKEGILFEKDLEKASKNLTIAANCGLKEAYFQLLLMASEAHDIEKEKAIYIQAMFHQIYLPGIVE